MYYPGVARATPPRDPHVQLDEDSTFLIPQELVEKAREISSTTTVAWCVWWRSDRASPSGYRERGGGGGRRRLGWGVVRLGHLWGGPWVPHPLPYPSLYRGPRGGCAPHLLGPAARGRDLPPKQPLGFRPAPLLEAWPEWAIEVVVRLAH